MRLPGIGRKVTGLEGLKAWAQEMTHLARVFPEGEDAYFSTVYLSTAINMTMLRDHCLAEPFLRQAIKAVPDFQPELSQAVECYQEVVRLRDSMDTLISDNFSPQSMKAIAAPKIRRAYADAILRIRDMEEDAVKHIELLLERCGKTY